MNTVEKYYAVAFPRRLFIHEAENYAAVSTTDDPEDSGSIVAEFRQAEQIAFAKEMIRRWNGFPLLEAAIMDVRQMASNRKAVIRMPAGMLLDNFCGQTLRKTH